MKGRGPRGWATLWLLVLGVIHLAALGADWLAPYDPATQHREHASAPPTQLHFRDAEGHWHWRPFVYQLRQAGGEAGRYVEDRSRPFPVRFGVSGVGESGGHWFGVESPAAIYLLGTDDLGRCRFSRLLHGARISLFTGLLAAGLAVLLGIGAGLVAGLFGGRVDGLLMRTSELFMALPWLYLLLAVRASLPLDAPPVASFLVVIAALAGVGWARPARLVRGVVLGARESDYVRAARGFGASHTYLLWRHLLPRALPVALTQATLLIPKFIVAEVTLSFLGLGVSPPTPSWGSLLAALESFPAVLSDRWMMIPVPALLLVIVSYYQVGRWAEGRIAEAG